MVTLEAALRTEGDATIIILRGELDVANYAELRDLVNGAQSGAAAGGRLLIDLSRCTFMDSSVLGLLVDIHRRSHERGTAFALFTSTNETLLRLLEITKLDEFFVMADSVDSWLQAHAPERASGWAAEVRQ